MMFLTIIMFPQCSPAATNSGDTVKRKAKISKPSIFQMDNSRLTFAEKVAKAMAFVESGGKPITGASGEIHSVWQYTQTTWNSLSKEYNKSIVGINKPLQMTRSNEELVTVWKVQRLCSRGWNASQIALIWNTSLCGAEEPYKKKGVNKYGVAYDSERHAQKVDAELAKLF